MSWPPARACSKNQIHPLNKHTYNTVSDDISDHASGRLPLMPVFWRNLLTSVMASPGACVQQKSNTPTQQTHVQCGQRRHLRPCFREATTDAGILEKSTGECHGLQRVRAAKIKYTLPKKTRTIRTATTSPTMLPGGYYKCRWYGNPCVGME